MEKRLYNKPLMSVEQFTPNEYVADCFYIKGEQIFSELYHDLYKNGLGNYGTYNWSNLNHGGEEDVTTPTADRIPANTGTYINGAPPTEVTGINTNGNKYYEHHEAPGLFNPNPDYYDQVTTLYTYVYNGNTYYLSDYVDKGGNHS